MGKTGIIVNLLLFFTLAASCAGSDDPLNPLLLLALAPGNSSGGSASGANSCAFSSLDFQSASAASGSSWRSITYENGLFVAGDYDVLMTSPDGITWTAQTSPPVDNWWYSIALQTTCLWLCLWMETWTMV